MVFAPEAAPKKRPAFLDWYDEQTEWEEGHGYDDPAIATPTLRAFHADLAAVFRRWRRTPRTRRRAPTTPSAAR